MIFAVPMIRDLFLDMSMIEPCSFDASTLSLSRRAASSVIRFLSEPESSNQSVGCLLTSAAMYKLDAAFSIETCRLLSELGRLIPN